MKKLITVAFLITAFSSYSASSSEEETKGLYAKIGQNYFALDNKRNLEDDNDFYFGMGYQFSKDWGVELEFTEIETDNNLGSRFDLELWSVNAIYRKLPKGENSAFIKVGIGENGMTNVSDDTAGRIGIGYDFAINNRFSWQLGVDSTFSDHGSPDFILYTGVSMFFGGDKSNPAPLPAVQKDTDRDGVFDSNDQCPNSPINAKVNSSGCQLDSDNDGVVDSNDQCLSTPAGAKVDALGCQVRLTENISIRINVKFANDSNAITSDYHQEIAKIANFMVKYPSTSTVIEGHTDSVGSSAYNMKLSQKRADAVMTYLIENFQIAKNRVSAIGKGEAFPLEDNSSAKGRQINRRVVAEIKAVVKK